MTYYIAFQDAKKQQWKTVGPKDGAAPYAFRTQKEAETYAKANVRESYYIYDNTGRVVSK